MDTNVTRQSLHVSSIVNTGNEIDVSTTNALAPPTPRNTYAMKTRAKSGVLNQRLSLSQQLFQLPRPILKPPSILNDEMQCVRNSMLFKHKVLGS
ncbi:putative mitochondrial protein [Cucumis melo var. makuwa]|uniref:Mitochondrial protein n=1 Tax=Cucumis melo var. makuwa TaxID=1194695 RepID=A0A5A7UDC0_CUCMM|nr:putative mitochondrial protein [Cucumis melo var. makuwa]